MKIWKYENDENYFFRDDFIIIGDDYLLLLLGIGKFCFWFQDAMKIHITHWLDRIIYSIVMLIN